MSDLIRCGGCWGYYDRNGPQHLCPAPLYETVTCSLPGTPRWQRTSFQYRPLVWAEVCAFLDSIGEAAACAKVVADAVMGEVVVVWLEAARTDG